MQSVLNIVNQGFFFLEKNEMDMKNKLKELEEKIGYTFHDKDLLEQAMRHSSYANEHHMGRLRSNERLEFLGDAVLELVSSEFLFHLSLIHISEPTRH